MQKGIIFFLILQTFAEADNDRLHPELWPYEVLGNIVCKIVTESGGVKR